MHFTNRVAPVGVVGALCSLLLVAAPVLGATESDDAPPAVRVESVDLSPDGESAVSISVSGLAEGESIDRGAVELIENGAPVEGLRVDGASGEPSQTVPAVVLAVDTSGSTEGAPLAAAIAAGRDLVQQVDGAGLLTGLVEFGPTVVVHARPGDPAESVIASLEALEAQGETLLYDGLARSTRLLSTHDGPRDVVVFSDGVDNGSGSTLDTVRALAESEDVRVTAVALDAGDLDLAPLEAIADATGGSVLRVTDPDQLLGAFAGVARDLATRLRLSWTAEAMPRPVDQLSFEVRLATSDGPVSERFIAFNPRVPAITPPREITLPTVPVPALGGPVGVAVALVTTFLAVLSLTVLAVSGVGERRRRERLASRLEGWNGLHSAPDDAVEAAATLSKRAADAVDRLPKPRGLEERLARLLERADWPMRPSEFQLVTAATVLGGLLVPLILTRSLPLGLLGLLAGLVGPLSVLRLSVRRRVRAFEEQLPGTLALLAGALRAGHSFTTALEGAIREVDEPAHSELRRAAVEHRLGRPVPEALRGVSDRMQSTDLRWVVTAIAIQQEVGGNLAELLDNVAATLRDRASLVRSVRALSAEGRLSAWVIGAMPFVMFVVMSLLNPDYTSMLYSTAVGRVAMALAAVLMAVGAFWLSKLVQPKY